MISVVINNYNYGRFIGECLDSVLAQTVPVDEIVFVDDGSSDNSLEVVRAYAERHPNIKPFFKANGGQLSSINHGFLKASGDILFFLDSDDMFAPTHVEKALAVYAANPSVDYVFCAMKEFGNRELDVQFYRGDKDLGFSFFKTVYGSKIVGGPTSTISMRRRLLEKFLPIVNEDRWTLCADTSLNVGSSINMARKYYIDEQLTHYRVHGNNNYISKKLSYFDRQIFRFETTCLVGHFLEQTKVFGPGNSKYFQNEFVTTTTPRTAEELKEYKSICNELFGFSLRTLAEKYRLVSAYRLGKYKS